MISIVTGTISVFETLQRPKQLYIFFIVLKYFTELTFFLTILNVQSGGIKHVHLYCTAIATRTFHPSILRLCAH